MKAYTLPSLSIFFPTYNEEENISKQVKAALAIAKKVANEFEILIINDGSKDNTREIAKQLEAKYSQVRLVSQRNKGYGGAVKRGFAEAKYEWVFYTDADLQFDMQELQKFVRRAKNNKLIIGYRKKRADGWKRVLLANMLKQWNYFWLRFPRDIKDIDCAFKLIHRDVIEKVKPLVTDGAMMTTEFLLKAYRKGYKPVQIGVTHYDRQFGEATGSNRKVIIKAVKETFILVSLLTKDFYHTKATQAAAVLALLL